MNRKQRIHKHIDEIGNEILGYITEKEGSFIDRWVPASEIRENSKGNSNVE